MEAVETIIRYQVNQYIFDFGYAPTVDQLSSMLNLEKNEIEAGLTKLSETQNIVLHPNSFDIWVAHPFALFPTLFWVKTATKQWWGNCPWCSLGIASITKTDTDIFTKLKGQEEPLKIEIRSNRVIQENYLVHFPIPAKKFWDNIIYACSMMQVFNYEIDQWCLQHNKPKGEIVPINQVWNLAQTWYGNFLDDGFKLKTKEIAEDRFKQAGLTTDFWKL